MSRAYFTTPISENLEITPEGFLIARDVTIGRTGWQTYKVGDLPKAAAERLGVDVSNPNAEIDVYRPADEVFHPEALGSFEGKPVTDNHPPDFVDPSNFQEYSCGHIQYVRKGKDPLESGEWPMIADVHITAEPLLSKVKNKMVRELSCGYDYSINKIDDRIIQCEITGNHLAVVPKGRAGSEARINDAAPEPQATLTETAPAITVVQEKPKVKDWRKHLLGLGFKAIAADSEPEELAEAAKAMHEEPPAQSGEDKEAKDKPGDQEPPAVMSEDRKRVHDALERVLDKKGTDADIEELKKNVGEFLNEEKQEPEHEGEDELAAALGGEAEDAEVCEDCGLSMDECECEEAEDADPDKDKEIGEVTMPSGKEKEEGEDRASANDAAVTAAKAVLKMIRPAVARSKDSAVHQAFNTALGVVTKSSRAGTGDYGRFAGTARGRDRAPKEPESRRQERSRTGDAATEDRNQALQKAYDAARTGGK